MLGSAYYEDEDEGEIPYVPHHRIFKVFTDFVSCLYIPLFTSFDILCTFFHHDLTSVD